jgi:hypothetical protein
MIDTILKHFPPHTHPLTLVSDPDGLLGDERLLAKLADRGFTLINESDPLRQWHRYTTTQPPHIIVTPGDLNQLPYSWWQQGQQVELALHTFFPNLAYPLLQSLTPGQRARLAQAPQPTARLGQRETIGYLFEHVFDLNLDALDDSITLLNWLTRYHRQADPLPQSLQEHLLEKLESLPVYADWPLPDLIVAPEAFRDFIQEQWLAYLENQTGMTLRETSAAYCLDFERNVGFQVLLQLWLRWGWLSPAKIPTPKALPVWAEAGVLAPEGDHRLQRFCDLLTTLEEALPADPEESRWVTWQPLAWDWANVTQLRYSDDVGLTKEHKKAYEKLQTKLNDAFYNWLRKNYAPLALKSLPIPHHLHHVPAYLAYRRRTGRADKIALIILDGMALADWSIIRPVWRSRHENWRIQSQLLLAQIPTVTSISRQALISGLRPVEFEQTIDHNRQETNHWKNFWTGEGISPRACQVERIRSPKDGLDSSIAAPRTRALCLIDNAIDNIIHNTSLGATDAQQSVRLWLKEHAHRLETQIEHLLEDGFMVYLTSDHGHTQAHGMGQPREGLIVQTRGRRARTYTDERLMNTVQDAFSQTLVWHGDGLLPDDVWVLIPKEQREFAPHDEIHVTHGGLSLDEMVVPLVEITLSDR